jgi:flagellar motor switch protein FliG
MSSQKKPPRAWITGAFDGKKAVAELLEKMNPDEQARWLQTLEKESGLAVAAEVKKRLFRFETLFQQDPNTVRDVLGQVSVTTLAIALRGAPEDWVSQVLAHLTQRAGQLLRETLAEQGPQKASKIREAQQLILAALQKKKSSAIF